MKRLPIVPSVLLLISAIFLEAREPTELEQYYLELVNRARADPEDEVTRLAGKTRGDDGSPAAASLNEGSPSPAITASPKQPLAFDGALIDSASDYSDFLLATEQFGHNFQGSSSDRMAAAGYNFGHTSGSGENLLRSPLFVRDRQLHDRLGPGKHRRQDPAEVVYVFGADGCRTF